MEMNYIGVEFIIHPDRLMTKDSQNYDIGLLKLDRKVIFDVDISPICLGSPYQDAMEAVSSIKPPVFISGFGLTLYKTDKNENNPECSTNSYLPRWECERQYWHAVLTCLCVDLTTPAGRSVSTAGLPTTRREPCRVSVTGSSTTTRTSYRARQVSLILASLVCPDCL